MQVCVGPGRKPRLLVVKVLSIFDLPYSPFCIIRWFPALTGTPTDLKGQRGGGGGGGRVLVACFSNIDFFVSRKLAR